MSKPSHKLRDKLDLDAMPQVAGANCVAQPSRPPKSSFTATLFRPSLPGKAVSWTFLTLPKAASAKLPSRGQVTVQGTLNTTAFCATLEPDGQGGHWLKVDRKLREAAEAEPGDAVTVEITPIPKADEPEPQVPPDFRKALAAAPKKSNDERRGALDAWSDITPLARREWIQWITSGKRAETRVLRIEKACDMLANGKRRPCCFDRSGMYSKSLCAPSAAAATAAPKASPSTARTRSARF